MVFPNSLLDEIRELQESRESGVLALSSLDQRVEVVYREGMIQAASSNLEAFHIGRYFVKEEYLDGSDLPRVLKAARREKILCGEAALRRKFLDPPELADIVRRQAMDLLKHAVMNGFVRLSFTKGFQSF